MALYVFYGVLAGSWVASIVACVLATRWSCSSAPRRFMPAVVLSLSALAIAYLGITRFFFTSTTTVNGQVKWRFDSRWPFMASLVLSALALGYTIWKRSGSASGVQPNTLAVAGRSPRLDSDGSGPAPQG